MVAIFTTCTCLISLGNATDVVATALIDQGLILTELNDLEPDDLKTLCSSFRRPGGLLDNGSPNLGTNVPTMLQLKLIVAVCVDQFYETVGRTVTPEIMTWAYIKQFTALKDLISN